MRVLALSLLLFLAGCYRAPQAEVECRYVDEPRIEVDVCVARSKSCYKYEKQYRDKLWCSDGLGGWTAWVKPKQP